jgi:hypothetical protein
MIKRLVIALSLCLLAMQVNAERILVVIEGQLSAIGSDTYGLNGASFRGSYVYDVVSGPQIWRWWDQADQPGNCLDTGNNEWYCSWSMAYAHVDFSDRPGGLADASTDLSGLSLTASHHGGVSQDREQWFYGAFHADLFGNYSGEVRVSDGLFIDEGITGGVTPWSYTDFRDKAPIAFAHQLLTGVGANYAIVSPTFEASVIPIPPAVWLFGSALSLIGVMRRKVS